MISFQCTPGFIPEGRVMSVCGGDGRWSPDPDQYSCREGTKYNHLKSMHNIHIYFDSSQLWSSSASCE